MNHQKQFSKVDAWLGTFFRHSQVPQLPNVFVLGCFERRPSSDVNERIEEVIVMSWREVLNHVARDEIFRGMTESALLSYSAQREVPS